MWSGRLETMTFGPIHGRGGGVSGAAAAGSSTSALGSSVSSRCGWLEGGIRRRSGNGSQGHPTMHLLRTVGNQLRRPVSTLGCDATVVPLPDVAAPTPSPHCTSSSICRRTRSTRCSTRRYGWCSAPGGDRSSVRGTSPGRPRDRHVKRFDLPSLELFGQPAVLGVIPGLAARAPTNSTAAGWILDGQIRPRLLAAYTASARLLTSSLRMMSWTWNLAVVAEM